MARPYSQDLRDRVVAAVASGRPCRAVAARFGVSVASVVKWSQRWRATGSAAAKPMGGRRPLRLAGERAWLLARLAEKPDLTLRAVVAELAERGTPASCGAVWRFLAREGISFQKKACTPASRIALTSPDGGRGGRCIRAGLTRGACVPRRNPRLREGRLWAKTNMTRRHGRCARGARLIAKVPHGRWRTLSSWRRCAITASPHPASSTGRSTAPAVAPISSSFWCRA